MKRRRKEYSPADAHERTMPISVPGRCHAPFRCEKLGSYDIAAVTWILVSFFKKQLDGMSPFHLHVQHVHVRHRY